MLMTRKFLIPLTVMLGLVLVTSRLQAQEVFVTGASNEIHRVDYASDTTEAVIKLGGNLFQGLDVRVDGLFGVGDKNTHQVFLLEATDDVSQPKSAVLARLTPAGSLPVAISFDPDGHAFVVEGLEGFPDVWRVPRDLAGCPPGADPFDQTTCGANGGYLPAVKIDTVDSAIANTLADVKFLTSPFLDGDGRPLLETGDIVVLVQDPPKLLRYEDAVNCTTCLPETLLESALFDSMTVSLLRFGGHVGYATRFAFKSLSSYSMGLMFPRVEWRRLGL